jgi:hypothetical protein
MYEYRTASVLAFTETLTGNDSSDSLHIGGRVARESPQLFFILVYIHPRANASPATEHIKNTLDELELLSPDASKFIMGDFNHCSIDKSLKGFSQYANCTSCLGKILDKCYGSVPDVYRAVSLPPLGSADHRSKLLAPAYTPGVKRTEKVIRDIKQWTPDSLVCKGVLKPRTGIPSHPLQPTKVSRRTFSAYITLCVHNTIPSKNVTIFYRKLNYLETKKGFHWLAQSVSVDHQHSW